MKGSRTKDKDKARVIETKINNPDITLQKIQDETGVNYETARKIIKEDLPEVVKSSENCANLIDVNNNLQSMADNMLKEMLETRDKVLRPSDLISLRESAFKQNQLLTGKATERKELKIEGLSEMPNEKLTEAIFDKIK